MIQLNRNQIDLGSIKLNTQHRFNVTVQNTGNKSIIVDTKPYCGACTTARVKKSTLVEGESTTIDLVFTPSSKGMNAKVVGILENNVETTKLTFTANVV